MKAQVLLVAAGAGTRLGQDCPKALVELAGVPMLVRTLRRFANTSIEPPAIVTAPPPHARAFAELLENMAPEWRAEVIPGGAERQDSVVLGLAALQPDTDIVAIHDAARPFVTGEAIEASIAAAAEVGAATVAIPSADTILVDNGEGELASTPDRRFLWACQTPQTFQVGVIRDAHGKAHERGLAATDDATVVRETGGHVRLVMGSALNFKITTPDDLALARAIIDKGLA